MKGYQMHEETQVKVILVSIKKIKNKKIGPKFKEDYWNNIL